MTTISNPLLSDRPAEKAGTAGFHANDGNQLVYRRGRTRRVAVSAAWDGLLQHRLRAGGAGMPSPWELARPIQAVSIALEAAGCTPSAVNEYGARTAPGYSVCLASDVGTARVSFKIPVHWEQVGSAQRLEPEVLHQRMRQALERYREVLESRGWEVTARRMNFLQAYLLVEPRTP